MTNRTSNDVPGSTKPGYTYPVYKQWRSEWMGGGGDVGGGGIGANGAVAPGGIFWRGFQIPREVRIAIWSFQILIFRY